MSTTASKHTVLWGGHVGHVWLVWLGGYGGITTTCSLRGGVNIGMNVHRCELTRCGPKPMKATTIHVSGVCLGTIQTTWDQVATLWTAVFTASHIIALSGLRLIMMEPTDAGRLSPHDLSETTAVHSTTSVRRRPFNTPNVNEAGPTRPALPRRWNILLVASRRNPRLI